MTKTADVVIVGGGVMGTAIAHELARRGAGSIVLIEKSGLAAGSSGKSGANIRCHYSRPLTTSMALYGLRTFEAFPEQVGGPAVFTRAGMIVIAPSAMRASLAATIELQKSLGVEVNFISADELRDIDEGAKLGEGEIAAFESEAGYCDAVQVVTSYAAAARAGGAEIHEGVRVTSILTEDKRVSGVATTQGDIATRTVVLAAGPWSAAVARGLDVALPVRSCRVEVALLRTPCEPMLNRPQPLYCDFSQEIYHRPLPGGLLHIGNIDPREVRDEVDPDNYNEIAGGAFIDEMREKVERRYPPYRHAIGRGGYAALYSVTPDWHPILDRLPGVEGAFCAAGFSGHGFKMAPAVSKVITEMILDGQATSFDVSPLDAKRFDEGRLFVQGASAQVMG
ncbi:MAG: FAD-binding oxidoreductase [Acidobacteria bacterium]|nr:FAD-binding oxidoreductase [Acidobacteriota bacterium]